MNNSNQFVAALQSIMTSESRMAQLCVVHDDASKRGNGRDAVARAVHAHLSNDGFFDLGAVETRQIISIAYAYVVDVALAAG
jgi:hypothetical protein